MMHKYIFLTFLLLVLAGCSEEKEKPMPTADLQLKPVSFDDLRGFDADDMSSAYEAFRRGCAVIARQKGDFLGNGQAQIKISRPDYIKICAAAEDITPDKFKDFIRQHFRPYPSAMYGSSAALPSARVPHVPTFLPSFTSLKP